MVELADMAMRIAVMLLAAGAVYGGIRSDLKTTRQKAEDALLVANRAHSRIDDHLQNGRRAGD